MRWMLLFVTACNGEVLDLGEPGDDDDDNDDSTIIDGDDDDDDDSIGDDDDDDDDSGPDLTQAEEVCARWDSDRADLSEGSWSGSLGTCDSGDISATGRANALKLINLYRWMVGLDDDLVTDPSRDAAAQDCALMMHAYGGLSHNPDSSWDCYTSDGDSAAGNSNIATTPGVTGVDLYMVDPGNPTTMGHRRWILSNGLGPVGLGSTSSYSCMWVIGGSGSGSQEWTAFPPPGPVPISLLNVSWQTIDDTGWTVQSNSINLNGTTARVYRDGTEVDVDTYDLLGGYGSTYAIRFEPDGWTTQAGHSYEVVVDSSPEIRYTVDFVDCDTL